MSDSAWVLKGIDPETRARAVEGPRLGVSLGRLPDRSGLASGYH